MEWLITEDDIKFVIANRCKVSVSLVFKYEQLFNYIRLSNSIRNEILYDRY